MSQCELLRCGELDANTNGDVDRTKLYWNWIADIGASAGWGMQASDPNRLVTEQRTGDGLA